MLSKTGTRRCVNQCLILAVGLTLLAIPALPALITVDATSDIYAAGHSTLPATIFPGNFPPLFSFTAGPNQVLLASSTGLVGCNFNITNGPDGTCFPGVDTTVRGLGGISGISVKQANMFLTGVFLNASEPAGAGPIALTYDFGTPGSLKTSDPTFAPAINQVFFIGDGLTGTGSGQQQLFIIPSDASRLYLGFADSFDTFPSFYADDVGSLLASVSITQASSLPEPASLGLVGLGLLGLVSRWALRGRRNR